MAENGIHYSTGNTLNFTTNGTTWATLTSGGTFQMTSLSASTYSNLPSSSSYRHDFNVYDYLGVGPSGSLDGDNVWTITRLTIASNGSVTSGVATDVNWTDRYTHTYL